MCLDVATHSQIITRPTAAEVVTAHKYYKHKAQLQRQKTTQNNNCNNRNKSRHIRSELKGNLLKSYVTCH